MGLRYSAPTLSWKLKASIIIIYINVIYIPLPTFGREHSIIIKPKTISDGRDPTSYDSPLEPLAIDIPQWVATSWRGRGRAGNCKSNQSWKLLIFKEGKQNWRGNGWIWLMTKEDGGQLKTFEDIILFIMMVVVMMVIVMKLVTGQLETVQGIILVMMIARLKASAGVTIFTTNTLWIQIDFSSLRINLIFCITRDYRRHIEKGFQTKWPLEMPMPSTEEENNYPKAFHLYSIWCIGIN